MSNHDPISDMLTRIRNASQKKHTTTSIPSSKMSLSIAKVLQKEGFISDINEEGETGRILTEEASLHASNVMFFSKEKNLTSKIEYFIDKEGVKKRRLKKTGEVID